MPLNLLIMFVLLLYTQKGLNGSMLLFVALCILTGMTYGLVATKTGDFRFGNVLGPSVNDVPLVIGIHWFIIVYCAGVTIQTMLTKILDKIPPESNTVRPTLKAMSIMFDAATIAVFLGWLIEPVAGRLGWWQWERGIVPFYNYACLYIVCALLLLDFHYAAFNKQNKFAIHLLLIQAMYFLILRTFL
ncbi:MAG: carotenoid biosynthesis protein [Bacteroidetes bacterium]|nr:carotenoid biosynthesis protein [Bacteroidota bacterium]